MTNLPLPPFTMLRISYSAKNVVRYRCNNIVLGGKGGANTKSQKFLHLIVAASGSNPETFHRILSPNLNRNHLGSFSNTTPPHTTLHFLKSYLQPTQNRTQSPHRHTPWHVAMATFTSFSILFVHCTQSAVLFGCFRKFFLHNLYINLTTHLHLNDSYLHYNVSTQSDNNSSNHQHHNSLLKTRNKLVFSRQK